MGTALISTLTKRPVSLKVAMTGEITLRGKVLPVAGLKEKCLAAYRSGIPTIIVPDRNEKDLDEIPKPLRRRLRFILAKTMSDVLDASLLPRRNRSSRAQAAEKNASSQRQTEGKGEAAPGEDKEGEAISPKGLDETKGVRGVRAY